MAEKVFELNLLHGNRLRITVEDGRGEIDSTLQREVCPSCNDVDCCFECDGSQGADADNKEDEPAVSTRLQYNGFLDAVESIALAHACAGIDVQDARYVQGLETALQAAENTL
jgi:hypothetical protein